MRAYFTDALPIGDAKTLARVAAEAGLDAEGTSGRCVGVVKKPLPSANRAPLGSPLASAEERKVRR